MSKVKKFEAESITKLENEINQWLRYEFITFNHIVNIKAISHTVQSEPIVFSALIVYEYV